MNWLQHIPVGLQTVVLLAMSNVFMTFAWYGHLKNHASSPWYVAALVSWGIALFEYLLQVPANRIGHTQFSVAQLKIIQEVITLSVFAPFAVLYLNQPSNGTSSGPACAWWARCILFFAAADKAARRRAKTRLGLKSTLRPVQAGKPCQASAM
ncbi:uncharacterized protein (DUF486 family) [Delftia sp. 60]|nr:uncharacterized protein (DUF486 family) [Delftia sp. 60]